MQGGELLKSFLEMALKEKRNLTEDESYEMLSNNGVPVPKYLIASSIEESVEKAKEFGFPLY